VREIVDDAADVHGGFSVRVKVECLYIFGIDSGSKEKNAETPFAKYAQGKQRARRVRREERKRAGQQNERNRENGWRIKCPRIIWVVWA
jgi:hypothetical protein